MRRIEPGTRRLAGIGALAFFAGVAGAADTELINAQTPWRVWLVMGPGVVRDAAGLQLAGRRGQTPFDPASPDTAKGTRDTPGFSRLPPADWRKADFDDRYWPRYLPADLSEYFGDGGAPRMHGVGSRAALLCLRTAFGVADPARATDLKATVTCTGGATVFVNGEEAGRGFLPSGAIAPLSVADDYPQEAYTTDDGKTPLPLLGVDTKPDAKWLERYQKRARTFTVNIPARLLVKGRNVLAVELHQSATAGPVVKEGWNHLGLDRIALTSASGTGVTGADQALQGVRVWSANAEEQVAETVAEKIQVRRSQFKTLLHANGMPVRGVANGNPFDPVLPMRMASPRNGVCSGQTVLSDLQGLRGVTAALGPLKGPQGATIPPKAVSIRYAVQPPSQHYCDALMPAPPEGAKTLPVWVIVEVPRDQAPGWYAGSLALSANGKSLAAPVQVLVTGLVLPDAKDFSSDIGVTQSPDTLAQHYKVAPWSDAHFRLLEKSLALMGQLGNDVMQVPVITENQFNWRCPLIRFVKTGDGLRPDFTAFQKYVDLYAKHCAPPRAMVLYIWDPGAAERIANVYEGRQIPTRENKAKIPLKVQAVDSGAGVASEVEAPRIGDPGSEAFYKALVDGVKGIVEKRGWSSRCILLGLGGDNRPSAEHAALIKEWVPYARWDLLSHFSGDPGSIFVKDPQALATLKAGKLIATGGLEVGLKEHPWIQMGAMPTSEIEKMLANPTEFVNLQTARWLWQEYSPPFMYRVLPIQSGSLGRVGLDFWLEKARDRNAARNTSYFTASSTLTVPGPDGAVPAVRFQMMREGVQDMEVRYAVLRGYAKLPESEKKSYRDLLDEFPRRYGFGAQLLSQADLAYDWPGYVARVQETAADLAGVKSDAKWDQPPKQ